MNPNPMALQTWHKEMIKCLFPYSGQQRKIETGFSAKNPHIPNKLYKYRDFSNSHHITGLEQGKLWFSSPNNFNDPLDTTAKFNHNHLPVQRQSAEECLADIAHIRQIEQSGGTWHPPEITNPINLSEWESNVYAPLIAQLPCDMREAAQNFISLLKQEMNTDAVQQMSDLLQNGFSVLSLSADPTSQLMWAHYAASHTGFCIEYNFEKIAYNNLRRRLCFPVFYRKRLRDISRYLSKLRPNFNNYFGIYVCLMKKIEWEYEQEWRIVHPSGPSNANRNHDMPPPSTIIVGQRVSNENLEYAQLFCTRLNIPIKKIQFEIGSEKPTIHFL